MVDPWYRLPQGCSQYGIGRAIMQERYKIIYRLLVIEKALKPIRHRLRLTLKIKRFLGTAPAMLPIPRALWEVESE